MTTFSSHDWLDNFDSIIIIERIINKNGGGESSAIVYLQIEKDEQ